MNSGSDNNSLFDAVLRMYDRWSSQAFLYSITVFLTTSVALVLDLRFHWSSERVLLYVLPLTVILLLAVPTLLVVLKRVLWKRRFKPRIEGRNAATPIVLHDSTSMLNLVRSVAREFLRRSPTSLLVLGVFISLIDFVTLYAAAAKDGVLHITEGVGLLDDYRLFLSIISNTLLIYLTKKYYECVCSIRTSQAIVNLRPINKSLLRLTDMIMLKRKYGFLMYGLIVFGILSWLSNVATYVVGAPETKWGHKVFDSPEHSLSFFAGRIHNFYSWVIIMPIVAYIIFYSSLQLRQAIATASRESALKYDLLNPDRRGGFGFLRDSQITFSIITALVYLQILLSGFYKLLQGSREVVITYVVSTALLVGINVTLFADIYAKVKALKLEALNRLKENVFEQDSLSFEILKYCYKRRVSWFSIVSVIIQAAAILIAGLGKLTPIIERGYQSLRK